MPKQFGDPVTHTKNKFGIHLLSENAQPDQQSNAAVGRIKRKAEHSPNKNANPKRSALGNLTNAAVPYPDNSKNKYSKKKLTLTKKQSEVNNESDQNGASLSLRSRKFTTNNTSEEVDLQTATNSKGDSTKKLESEIASKFNSRRISNEFSVTEESLYMSALDDFPTTSDSVHHSDTFDTSEISVIYQTNKCISNEEKRIAATTPNDNRILKSSPIKIVQEPVPNGVVDFDKLNWNDPFQVSHYAMDIFNYLKSREKLFQIDDYIERQTPITKWMRSLLVDWMVEVQETFELNHETLYLAVKVVDLFLSKVILDKDKLQLLGAAAMFISCKYDERLPPPIEDFLYICDGAYNQNELIHMEMITLKAIDFNLSIPLSYRFLRRYARCANVPMPTLTLARYILELSLMDYAAIRFSDSKLASAGLFMALRMHGVKNPWTKTLEYYTGYVLEDFANIVSVLNTGLKRKPKEAVKTIRSKYSHSIFHEAAKVPVLSIEELFEK